MSKNFCPNNNISKDELLKIITDASFALDDTKLFLNTHPDCYEALKYYADYQKIRHIAMQEYTYKYGPMSAYDVKINDKWSWGKEPWPWEGVC